MSTRLVLEVPGRAPVELPARGRLVLGADGRRADLVLDGQGVDPVHCAVGRLKGGGWALKDLGSRYGTIVNGQRIESARLQAGDTLLLGSQRLRVVDPGAPAEATVSAPTQVPVPPPAPPPPPAAVVEEEPAPAPRTADDDEERPSLPGYRIERRIGRGGMGTVWLATQQSLDRRVAIKTLSARLEADPSFVERFQAEARAAAALSHPNVVTVHDVGEAHGLHYLTMEYMAAGCLETRLQALGPIPWREALGILRDAARGLEFAESRGVVHRDIKPANLMQTENGITKICDLGLAVQVEQEELSAGGKKVYGTPHFIAPEVVRGERPDPRSDLYSLGATAYRLLSGHTPFEGGSSKDILRRLLSEEPEPIEAVAPGVPPGVARMVTRLLEKDPTRRTPSAAVLVRELDRLIAQDGAQAPPPATGAGGPRPRTLVGAVVVVALVAAGAASLLGGGEAPDPEPGPPIDDPAVVEAPGPGPGPSTGPDGNGGEGPGVPDDERAKLVELQARNAYLTLENTQLTDPERIVALRALAGRFLGTDAAEDARVEADRIEGRLAAEANQEAQIDRERTALLMALRAAAELATVPPRPGAALRALRAVPGQEVWESDAEFVLARAALRDEVLAGAVAWAESTWSDALEQERNGDFEGLVAACRSLVALVDLPEFTPEDPPGAVRLRELADLARARKDAAEELEAAYLEQCAQADRAALAEALLGAAGLEQELLACDFAAGELRLEALVARLGTPEARARVEPWLEDLRQARAALDLLIGSWEAREWKRRTIMHPNGSTRDALGATRQGLLISTDGGSELLPWSSFGGHLRELDNLFTARLDRDWKQEELVPIAALMRLQAVVRAAQKAGELLDPERDARFSDGEADELDRAFDRAREWAERAGVSDLVAREESAKDLLSDAMRAFSDERWSEAVGRLERLLTEHGGSLLVSLLSDGSAWKQAPAPDGPQDEQDGAGGPTPDPALEPPDDGNR